MLLMCHTCAVAGNSVAIISGIFGFLLGEIQSGSKECFQLSFRFPCGTMHPIMYAGLTWTNKASAPSF